MLCAIVKEENTILVKQPFSACLRALAFAGGCADNGASHIASRTIRLMKEPA